jgi:integrase
MTAPIMNHSNDQLRHGHFRFLKGRVDNKTLDAKMRHIVEFEVFIDFRDFASLTEKQAIAFRDQVHERPSQRGAKHLSPSSIVHTLSNVKTFFEWLAKLKGQRRLNLAAVEYLTASNRVKVGARTGPDAFVPTPDHIRRAIAAITPDTPLNRRNRAMVAFLFLSGMRIAAVVSTRVKHVDLKKCQIDQDASEVDTKFGKNMRTDFFHVGSDIELIVVEWIQERLASGAGPDDPLFPATPSRFGKPVGASRNDRCLKSGKSLGGALKNACLAADIPIFNPHSIRSTVTILGAKLSNNREVEKAWSQNLGHDHVATTQNNYLKVSSERQHEIMQDIRTKNIDFERKARVLEKLDQLNSENQDLVYKIVETLET